MNRIARSRAFWLSALAALALLLSILPLSIGHGLAADTETPGTAVTVAAATAPASPAATAASSPAPTASSSALPTPIEEEIPPQHYVVLIVIDGGKPQYLRFPGLTNIAALMKHGVVYDQAWVGQMESTTPGVHVTYGTGTLPRENGFSGFGWVTPGTHQRVDFRALLANGQIDPVLRSLPVPSVAERLHQAIPGAISVAASGHKDYATVGLGGGYADYELYGKYSGKKYLPAFMHSPPPLSSAQLKQLTLNVPLSVGVEDQWAFKYAGMVVSKVRPRLLMINVPEPDTQGHWVGPANLPVFERLMRGVDKGIGALETTYRSLGLLDQTDFILTADHGMMESRPIHGWSGVDGAAAAVNAQVIRSGDGPIWLDKPAKAQAVARQILKLHLSEVEAVYYRSEPGTHYHYVLASPTSWVINSRAEAAMTRLVDTAAGINGPDIWVLFRENFTVIPRNVQGVWKGTHGGQSWRVQNVPLVISGPGIKSGIHSTFPARAVDIAPTMERLLGLPPIQRDGVILADAFSSPLSGESDGQRAEARQLGDDVQALQAQSRFDIAFEPRYMGPPAATPCRHAPQSCAAKVPGVKSTSSGPVFLNPEQLISGDDS